LSYCFCCLCHIRLIVYTHTRTHQKDEHRSSMITVCVHTSSLFSSSKATFNHYSPLSPVQARISTSLIDIWREPHLALRQKKKIKVARVYAIYIYTDMIYARIYISICAEHRHEGSRSARSPLYILLRFIHPWTPPPAAP
jgi:hypothetical protein